MIKNPTKANLIGFMVLLSILGSFFILYASIPFFILKLLFLLPFLVCICFAIYVSGSLKGFQLGSKAFFSNFPAFIGMIALISIIGFIGLIGFVLLNGLLVTFMSNNLDPSSLLGQNFELIVSTFVTHFYLLNFIIFMSLGVCQFIYIHKEKKEALSLLKQLDQFGKQENIRGLIRE